MNNQHKKWIKHHFLSSIHGPFSIAMLNNQRVVYIGSSQQLAKKKHSCIKQAISQAFLPFISQQHPHLFVGNIPMMLLVC